VQEFLKLSDADMELIETRLAASRLLKETRHRKKLTQAAVAAALQTSQSRLAKMEAGDPSVSLDLLFRSLFALGVSRKNLASSLSSI
jgi:transcriptional regulator with XRE-family HTH domain